MLSYDTIEFILGCDETEDNSRSQKNKIIKEVEYMTELRDKSVLYEAQTHLEAYKRGEEWAKKNVFDTKVRECEDCKKAQSARMSVQAYNSSCSTAKDYWRVCEEIIGR